MDLIRSILRALEGDESAASALENQYTREEVVYHAALLVEAKLAIGTIRTDERGDPSDYALRRMTWDGHDLLDAMRDETIWKKARDVVLRPIGGVAFDVLKDWLKAEMKAKLGIPSD